LIIKAHTSSDSVVNFITSVTGHGPLNNPQTGKDWMDLKI